MGTLPAQALPSAYASGRRMVPTLGGVSPAQQLVETALEDKFYGPKQSPVPGHRGCHSVAVTL